MKVTVCGICGDEGFSVALILCHKCQMHATHRYCLDKLPPTFNEYFTWFCVDCEQEITTPCIHDDLAPRENKRKRAWKNKKKKKKNKIHITDGAVVDIPECESNPDLCESVADIPESESNRDHSESVADIPECETNPDLSESVADIPECETNPDLSELFADIPDCESNPNLSESIAVTPICESTPSSKPTEVDCSDNRIKYRKLGQEKGSTQDNGEKSGQEVESVKCHASQMARVDSLNITNRSSQLSVVASTNISNQNSLIHAQPIVDPVWSGSFRFLNENRSISGLVAHLSSLACQKVVAESKLLPAILELEWLPRSVVWPKGFKKTMPTGDHIGLYFFPDNERDEKVFDTLVTTMSDDDFAMRAVVENAELLIFHSIVLPLPYWRFKTKPYLWGLFKSKQAHQSLPARDGREEEVQKNSAALGAQSPVSTLSNNNGSPAIRK